MHNSATQTDVPETYTYDYDNAGRPTTTTYKIFNDQTVLTNNKYDELGRVKTTYRHGGADTISYAYNIRNWTTMRTETMDMKLKPDTPEKVNTYY